MAASPLAAQEGELGEGLGLMEEGARLLMRGLINEIEPSLDELQSNLQDLGPAVAEFMQNIGPAFVEALEDIDDLRHYEAPEILPNGDIIIRRSPEAPQWNGGAEAEAFEGEIEL